MDENEKQLSSKDIKVLRTYSSDMADVIRKNEMSVIKIATAEKEKREKELLGKEIKVENSSRKFFILGGIILIIAVIIGLYFLFSNKKGVEVSQITNAGNIETFISYDSKSDIDTTNVTNALGLSEIIKKGAQPNSGLIKALFLTKKIIDANKKTETIETLTSKEFLSLIKTTAPETLIRTLSDKYLLGKYSTLKNEPTTFLIFQNTDYPQAYTSMLAWEKTIFQDLSVVFNINTKRPSNIPPEKQWGDLVVNNKDVRVLYDKNGEGILYYVFVDKNNFVIADNIEALKEIISRLIIKNPKPL